MRIDTDSLLDQVDFAALLANELGPPSRAGSWRCPFHEDHTPSFGIVRGAPRKAHCFGCGWSGDTIDFLMQFDSWSFRQACEAIGIRSPSGRERAPSAVAAPVRRQCLPPNARWQDRARAFCQECEMLLWQFKDKAGRDYLGHRGIGDDTARRFSLGWNPHCHREPREAWGLPIDPARPDVFLPAGLVIPWRLDDHLWRVNIRRLRPADGPKYIGPAGFCQALFNGDAVKTTMPALLVEGEIDAMIAHQYAGDLVAPVATGSTSGSRMPRWLYRLAAAPAVLIAFDKDRAGDNAATWWTSRLPHATRLRPTAHDPADMGPAVRPWIENALRARGIVP